MKPPLYLLLFALTGSVFAQAPALVQTNGSTNNSASNLSLSYSSNVTPGNLLFIAGENINTATMTVSSALGNTCTSRGTVIYDFTSGVITFWTCPVTTGGTETITLSGGTTKELHLAEFSGANNASPIDSNSPTSANVADGGGGSTITCPAFTTTVANETLIAAAGNPANQSISKPSGWTGNIWNSSQSNLYFLSSYRALSEAGGGSHSAPFNTSGSLAQEGCLMIGLKPAASSNHHHHVIQ